MKRNLKYEEGVPHGKETGLCRSSRQMRQVIIANNANAGPFGISKDTGDDWEGEGRCDCFCGFICSRVDYELLRVRGKEITGNCLASDSALMRRCRIVKFALAEYTTVTESVELRRGLVRVERNGSERRRDFRLLNTNGVLCIRSDSRTAGIL